MRRLTRCTLPFLFAAGALVAILAGPAATAGPARAQQAGDGPVEGTPPDRASPDPMSRDRGGDGGPGRPQGLRLGVIAPEEGLFAPLGAQVHAGVRAYAATAGAAVADIVFEPEACEDETGADAGHAMAEAAVDAVIGFLCPESLMAALPPLAAAGIPAITVGVRADIVMEDALKEGWPLFRLAPRADAEVARIVEVIARRWSGEPFALIEDGTIYGRELAEAVRVRLEELGIQPVFIDNYRPAQEMQFGLARRLRRSGATHVFVGGERSDIAIIARDAAELGLDLVFMGGDALKAADGDVPLPDGVLAVTVPRPHTLDSARPARRALAAIGTDPYGYAIPAFAAAEIVAAADDGEAGRPGAAELIGRDFATALGPVAFGADHERTDNPFRLMVWRGARFRLVNGS